MRQTSYCRESRFVFKRKLCQLFNPQVKQLKLYKMSAITKFTLILALVLSSQILSAHVKNDQKAETPAPVEETENGRPFSGMFFSAEYVVEEYEYDDAFCLLYDDADANLFEVEICVDLETYQMVQKAIEEKRELVGSLVLNDDYSFNGIEVYTFVLEPEFEMAAASAKTNINHEK